MPETRRILLISDLRILHALARELRAAISDVNNEYTLEEILATMEIGHVLDTIRMIETAYDWSLSLKQRLKT